MLPVRCAHGLAPHRAEADGGASIPQWGQVRGIRQDPPSFFWLILSDRKRRLPKWAGWSPIPSFLVVRHGPPQEHGKPRSKQYRLNDADRTPKVATKDRDR